MASHNNPDVRFLQWALPRLGYRWKGFRKPRGQVLKRIRSRIQKLGLSGGYPEYKLYLEEHPEEWKVLDRLCDVTISKFFRDRKLWDEILCRLIRDCPSEPVEVWSAGCCNGEEAYSVSVIGYQLSGRPATEDELSILASDRNDEVLERARRGRYPSGALKELTDEEVQRFFRPVEEDSGDDYQIDRQLARCIRFEQRDIHESVPDRVFDLVLCRNLVFTYFSIKEQLRFLERLRPHIKAGGYLVTGSNETLLNGVEWLKIVNKGYPVYRKENGNP